MASKVVKIFICFSIKFVFFSCQCVQYLAMTRMHSPEPLIALSNWGNALSGSLRCRVFVSFGCLEKSVFAVAEPAGLCYTSGL
jgi:hypothetical protein